MYLAPGGGTLQDVPICLGDCIRKLALHKNRPGDMETGAALVAQCCRKSGWRKDGENALGWLQAAESSDGSYQVAISRYQQSNVKAVLERVHQQIRCDIDVSHLLVVTSMHMSTGATCYRVVEKVPKVDRDTRQRPQGFDEGSLALYSVRGAPNQAGVIADLDECLMRTQKPVAHLLDVQPLGPCPALNPDTVVQVVAVDVSGDAFHGGLIQGTTPHRASR